jgi:hypothetical protein
MKVYAQQGDNWNNIPSQTCNGEIYIYASLLGDTLNTDTVDITSDMKNTSIKMDDLVNFSFSAQEVLV